MGNYYTPDIEEFYNGFEYEFHGMTTGGLGWVNEEVYTHVKDPDIKIWDKCIFGIYNGEEDFYSYTDLVGNKITVEIDKTSEYHRLPTIRELIKSGQIRVKHLDENDFAELGWKRGLNPNRVEYKNQNGATLIFNEVDNWVYIYPLSEDYLIFSGEIKNKSELKCVQKMLKL